MIKTIKIICIWTLVATASFCAVFVLYRHIYGNTKHQAFVLYKDMKIAVSIADTDALREQGLSGTMPLAPDTGMFFIFQNSGNYGFWMKDMSYPLDIVWLDSSMHIVYIAQNLTPATYPQVFYPNTNTQYVLEIPAFAAAKYNFSIGAQLTYKRD